MTPALALALIPPLLAGYLLAGGLATGSARPSPLLRLCLAMGWAMGTSSCLYFAWLVLGGRPGLGFLGTDLALFAGAGAIGAVLGRGWSRARADRGTATGLRSGPHRDAGPPARGRDRLVLREDAQLPPRPVGRVRHLEPAGPVPLPGRRRLGRGVPPAPDPVAPRLPAARPPLGRAVLDLPGPGLHGRPDPPGPGVHPGDLRAPRRRPGRAPRADPGRAGRDRPARRDRGVRVGEPPVRGRPPGLFHAGDGRRAGAGRPRRGRPAPLAGARGDDGRVRGVDEERGVLLPGGPGRGPARLALAVAGPWGLVVSLPARGRGLRAGARAGAGGPGLFQGPLRPPERPRRRPGIGPDPRQARGRVALRADGPGDGIEDRDLGRRAGRRPGRLPAPAGSCAPSCRGLGRRLRGDRRGPDARRVLLRLHRDPAPPALALAVGADAADGPALAPDGLRLLPGHGHARGGPGAGTRPRPDAGPPDSTARAGGG